MGDDKDKAPKLYREFCAVYGKKRLPEYEGLLDELATRSGDGGNPRNILKSLGVKLIAPADAPTWPEINDKKEQPQMPGSRYAHDVEDALKDLNNADPNLEYADIYRFLNQDKTKTKINPEKFPLTGSSDCLDLFKRSEEIRADIEQSKSPHIKNNIWRKKLVRQLKSNVFKDTDTKAQYEISRKLSLVSGSKSYNNLFQVFKKIGYLEPRQYNTLIKKAKAYATEASEKSICEYIDWRLHAAHIEKARSDVKIPGSASSAGSAIYDWLFNLTHYFGRKSAAAITASFIVALLIAGLVSVDWFPSHTPDPDPIDEPLQNDLQNAFRSANSFASDLAKLADVYLQRQRAAELVSMRTSGDYRGLLRKYNNELSHAERAANQSLDAYIKSIKPLIVLSDQKIRHITASTGHDTERGGSTRTATLIQKHVHDYRERGSADRKAWSADFRNHSVAGHAEN